MEKFIIPRNTEKLNNTTSTDLWKIAVFTVVTFTWTLDLILTVFSSCTTWLQGTAGACIAIFSSVGWRCTECQLEIQ